MTGCYRRRRVVVLAATVGLSCVGAVLAGCGSSSSKATASTAVSSVTSPARSAAASPSASPASEGQLAKIVLHPSDFPAGWQATPNTNDPTATAVAKAGAAAFAKCVGKPNSDLDKVAHADSANFDQGDDEISSDASSFPSQSVVDTDTAALHSAKAAPCFAQQLKQTILAASPAGAKMESLTFKITPGSAGGPANVVANGAGTFKVSASGTSVAGYISNTFITGPMIEANVTAIGTTPVPASLMDSLVAAVANRAAHP